LLWYDEYSERLEFELEALKIAGFTFKVDAERRSAGQIVLYVAYPISGVEHQLTVVFPPNYPYFAFQVFAPTLNLARHQDPYSKLLCFVANIDSEWNASTDTVVKYFLERLPEVIKASDGLTAVSEAREGAPITGYMADSFQLGSLVITAEWNLPTDKICGHLLIGFETGYDPNTLLRCAVHEVRDLDGNLLGEADAVIKARYPGSLNARWVRLPGPPKSSGALQLLADATSVWPQLNIPFIKGGPDVIGIVFQDEALYKEMHDLWVFVVRCRDRDIAPRGRKRLPPGDQYTCYLARADRGGRDDIQTRVPCLKALSDKKASIFGLGALGSTVAWQLARAGVGRLSLIDYDFVQVGNIPRWMIGETAAGFYKALVLSQHIAKNYPFVKPIPIVMKVGAPYSIETPQIQLNLQEKLMAQALENTNLLVDCTVEFTVQHFLSDLAWKLGIPYIWVSGTPGSWGGVVGRAIRGKTAGCWKCFRQNQSEGVYPSPSFDEGPSVQPVGCFSPTFTGTGFDMDSVALEAVRLAISTLSLDDDNGYPDFDWDVGIVDLWRDGRPITPHWTTFPLDKNKACAAHG
jgi:molybdopterin/thiamine biosynthesis adenylyltransferase